MPAPERLVYVSEHLEMDRRGPVATGLFDCEVRGLKDEWLGEYADPPLEFGDALAWARARADRVSVRLGGYHHSAGRVPFAADRGPTPDPPIDETLRFIRRRWEGWEFVDLTDADPPISWDVLVEVDTRSAALLAEGGTRTPLGERWLAAMEQGASVRVVQLTTTGADGRINSGPGWSSAIATTPVAVLRLYAQGYEAALRAAAAAAADAAAAAEWIPAPRFSRGQAFATGSAPARSNARIDTAHPVPDRPAD
jgi:hypothetical protein